MRIHVLPVTLVATLMVLPLKIGALVEGFPVVAQQFDREFGNHARPWADDLKTPAGPGGEASAPASAVVPDGSGPGASVSPAAAPAPLAVCADPQFQSALAEERAGTSARARQLADTEAVMAATEARVAQQIDRLGGLKHELAKLMDQRSALEQEDIRRMVSIYEAMKPKDAARIFGDLETDIVIDVLDRMPERRSAPIIAELADTKAREVTRIMMQRRALPGDRTATH